MTGKMTPEGPELLRAAESAFEYRQKCCPESSALDLLTYGTYHLAPGAVSGRLFNQGRETLLFTMKGTGEAQVEGAAHGLTHYDVLYVPLDTPFSLKNTSDQPAEWVVCMAPAEKKHPVYKAAWEEISNTETRIRHLDGKDVFLMFDVSEAADKLIAGYTIYEPNTRAWPPHNHTDQEEVYIFCKGEGSMKAYLEDEDREFDTPVGEMDAVTIPVLYYHPVFSREQELHFIWCIAGERYWVGDKNKDFMTGSADRVTT